MRQVDTLVLGGDGAGIQCLVASNGTLLAGDEAGSLHVADWRTKAPVGKLRVGTTADDSVNCVCVDPSAHTTAYAAAGNSLHKVDLRSLGSPAATYTFSTDEVNSVAVSRGGVAATADDNGEVKLVDLATGQLRHSFPAAHTSIASSTVFRGPDDSQLLTGGFDCRVIKWDVGRRKARDRWQMDTEDTAETRSKMFNPPFVHALAVPCCSSRPYSHYAAVARGDGLIEVFDVDNPIGKRQKRGGLLGLAVQLARDEGGHTRAATAVCFPQAGGGKLLVSGGDDRRLCCWDWASAAVDDAGGKGGAVGEGGSEQGPLVGSAQHAAKLNCLAGGAAAEGNQGGFWVGDVDGSVTWYLLQ